MKFTKEKTPAILQTYIGLPREIYILFVAKIINSLGRFIGPLLTLILTKKIGMSSSQAGTLITLSMILQAPCVLIGGKLADTIGRKIVICAFFGLSATTYLICAFMPENTYLAYTLILAACFSSFSGSAYDAMVTDITDVNNRQAAFSLLYMGINIGASIAPVLGGFLFERHLKILFLGDAITTIAAIILILLFVKEKETIHIMAHQSEEQNKAVKESVFHVLRETPILVTFSFILCIYSFVYQQYSFAIPLGTDAVFGSKGAGIYGLLCSINGLSVIFLTPFLVHITKRMRIKNILTVGGLCYTGCFLVMAVSNHIFGYIIGIVLLTIGEILSAVNAPAFIANISRASHLGRINSVTSLIRETGSCISPVIIGKILDFSTIQQAFMIIAAISMVGAACMFLLKQRRNEKEMLV